VSLFIMLATSLSAQAAKIKIYGHRGARGLSPENTIPAYKTGLAIGIDVVDMDVGITKDGVVVVTHNYALNPDITRDPNGKWIPKDKKILIKDLTFAQLKKYDVGRLNPNNEYGDSFPNQHSVDGTHISSLAQVIEYTKKTSGDKIGFQVEAKTDPAHPNWTITPEKFAEAIVNVLKQEKVNDRTELQAFDWRVLLAAQKLDPKLATAYLTDHGIAANMTSPDPEIAGLWSAGYLLKDFDNSIPKMIAKLGGKIWGPETQQLTKKLVDEAHSYGLKVVTWTADTPKVIERMISYGVDGIISDRPDLVRGLMADRGLKLPEPISISG